MPNESNVKQASKLCLEATKNTRQTYRPPTKKEEYFAVAAPQLSTLLTSFTNLQWSFAKSGRHSKLFLINVIKAL